jgi:hypothetical protein
MAMKITLSAAMRARDVSRPQPGDLTQAEEADATSARAPRAAAGGPRGTVRDRSLSAASQQRGPSPAPSSANASNTGAGNTGASGGSAGSAGSAPPVGRARDSVADARPAGGLPGGSSPASPRPPRPAEGRRRRRRR